MGCRANFENGLNPRNAAVILVLTAFVSSFQNAFPLPQSPGPDIQSLIGQNRILAGHGQEPEVVYRAAELSKPGSSCDDPVQVRNVSYSRNQLRFDLEDIGTLQSVGNTAVRQLAPCRGTAGTTKLSIRDVSPRDLAVTLKSVSENVLMTPETYLARRGLSFDFPPVASNEVPISGAGAAAPVAKPLLVFEPAYTDAARKARVKGDILLQFVVGSDGRIQSPVIVKGLSNGLNEQSLRILSLFRFEPVQQNGRPIAVSSRVQFSFHLY